MATIKVKCPDLVDKIIKNCRATDGTFLLDAAELKVDLEATIDDKFLGEVKINELEKHVSVGFKSQFERPLKDDLEDFSKQLKSFSDEDQKGDTKASGNASKLVVSENKLFKTIVGDARDIIRDLIIQKVSSRSNKVGMKQITTLGKSNFKEFKLVKEAFKTEPATTGKQEDITPILKKSNGSRWQYFGFAATGTAGRVIVDPKKKVTQKALKELKQAEDVPNNAAFYVGVIRSSATLADVHFVGSVLSEKDIKQCFKTSAPKFGSFKVIVSKIDAFPKDIKSYSG